MVNGMVLFNASPDTNHNANPTNPNRYSKGNPSRVTLTLLTIILDTENLGPPFTGLPTWANMLGLIANGGSYVALSHVGPYTVVSP